MSGITSGTWVGRGPWTLLGTLLFGFGLALGLSGDIPSAQGFGAARSAEVGLCLAGAALVCLATRPGRLDWLFPAAVFVAFGILFRYGVVDDAYISLRYARNWAEGLGPVWNQGERVEGYTSGLWVLLLAGAGRVAGPSLDRVALALGITCAVACFPLLQRLLRRGDGGAPPPLWTRLLPFILSVHLPFAFWGFSGMETSLHLCLLLAGLNLYLDAWDAGLRGRGVLRAGFTFGLATLARPEGAVHALALALLLTRHPRRARALPVYVGSAAALPLLHLGLRFLYYGDLLPNTFYVKVDFSSLGLMAHGAGYLLRGAAPHLPLLLLAILGLWAWSPRRPFSARDMASASLVVTQLLVTVYTGGDHFRELRFFVPVVPPLLLLAARAGDGGPRRLLTPAVLGCAAATLVLGVSSRALGYESSVLYGRALTKRWLATGEWLKKAARPGDLVATPVAGAIPYASGLPSIDMLGLNDRVIARRRVKLGGAEKDHEKYDAAYVLSRNPAWIYIGPFEAESIGDARRRASGLSVYRDLFRQLPSEGWELASGRYRGAGFSFLRRVP